MYDHFILQIAQTIELTIYLDSNTSKCMLLLKILHNQKKKKSSIFSKAAWDTHPSEISENY